MKRPDDRIYMLNALWFRPDGGSEQYAQFARAAGPIMSRFGARIVEAYEPELSLIGDWKPSVFFVVELPDFEAFAKLLLDPEYREIARLREAGLEQSIMIRCRSACRSGLLD
ncbi:MAG: DUF1330 domain-containing protein [Myxococcota bacterium]